jgi:NDP-mannose synthase
MAEFAPELPDALVAPLRASAPHVAPDLPTLEDVPIVILAGGRGTRLAPYTSVLPKPLMPVGDQAILEIVVGQLADFGARNISFCVGYLAHLIRAVFDHRARPEVAITYVHEHEALGTAAPLRLVDGLNRTFIAMNGDVLTTLDYRALLQHHRTEGNMLTIATHNRSIKTDYGMLHLDVGARVQAFEEKPEIVSPVSMGIYVMEPEVLEYIPSSTPFEFPELVQTLLAEGQPVGAYVYGGMWFDIGRADDYQQAVDTWMNGHADTLGSPAMNGRGLQPHHGSDG